MSRIIYQSYPRWLESSTTLLSQPHVSRTYSTAYFSNEFYATLLSAQLINSTYITISKSIYYIFYCISLKLWPQNMLHIKVTHWIYLFMMCLLIDLFYLPHLLTLFICLFICIKYHFKNCILLGYYTTHCMTAQKCTALNYFMVDAWNHTKYFFFAYHIYYVTVIWALC